MASYVDTPPELAGGAFEATLRSKAAELKRELIRQTLADVESWLKAFQNEYSQAHPDRPDDRVVGDGSGWVRRSESGGSHEIKISEQELAQYRNAVSTEYYEWVVPTFEGYLKPDPDAVNPMIESLRTIESMFGGSQDDARSYQTSKLALTRINDVRSEMEHWEGDFKISFIDNFVTPLQNTPVNQAAAAKMAREVLELTKLAYIAQRKAILSLLDTSLGALKELSRDKNPKAHTWATLVGIVAGTVLTGFGVTAWVGIALIGASTMSQGLTPDARTESNISAPTAQEIANRILDALRVQNERTQQNEDTVVALFRALKEGIVGSRAKLGELGVPRPSLTYATAADIDSGRLRPAGA